MARYALLTYQKAGSQWVRDVLFGRRTLARISGATAFVPDEGGRLDAWRALPEGTCGGPFYDVTQEEWIAWSRPQDVAVHVARDPRDRIVSWVFSMTASHVSMPNVEVVRAPLASLTLRERIMIGMHRTMYRGLAVERSWLDEIGSRNFISVSFEELIDRPHEAFAKIFATFGWEMPAESLEEILESEKFEVRSGGRARGENNDYSHYRRGVAGDWRNYFDRPLGELFENAWPHALVELGYERDDHWFEALPERNERLEDEDGSFGLEEMVGRERLDHLRRRVAALEQAVVAQGELIKEYRALTGIADVSAARG